MRRVKPGAPAFDEETRRMSAEWPAEVRLAKDRRALSLVYGEGRSVQLPAELLRVESPSAEVQGHSAAGRRLVPGKRDVAIASIEPIGNYAIRIAFDDGHATGIFSWTYLAELGDDPARRLDAYHRELAEAGLAP